MAMDFPNSPVQGTTYTQGVNTWTYDGAKWNINPPTVQGKTGFQGITGLQGIQGIQGLQGIQGIQGNVGFQGVQGQAGSAQGIQGIQGTDAGSAISIVPAKTSTYVVTSGDEGDLVSMNNAVAQFVIIPPNSVTPFVQGTQINIMRLGAGGVWVQGTNTTAVSVQGTPGLQLRAQYSSATLIKMGTDHWIVVGDLTA